MGTPRFPAAGILVAFLLLSASARPPPLSWGFWAWDTRVPLLILKKFSGVTSSAVTGAPSTGAETPLPEAAGARGDPGAPTLGAPSGTNRGDSGGATPGPSPSAPAEPAASSTPESWPVSPAARPRGEVPAPGSPATRLLLSPASPGPRSLGAEQKSSEAPALSAASRVSVVPGLSRQPAGAPAAPSGPAPGHSARLTFSPDAWVPAASTFRPQTSPSLMLAPWASGKGVSPGPRDPPVLTSTADTAGTEPLALGVPGWSGLDMAILALRAGSGSPGQAVASSPSPGPGGSSPWPPSWPPSHPPSTVLPLSLALSPLPTFPSPTSWPSAVLAPMSPMATRAGVSADPPPTYVFLAPATGSAVGAASRPPGPTHWALPDMATLQGALQLGPGDSASPAPSDTRSLGCHPGSPSALPSSVSQRVPGSTWPTQSSAPPHPSRTGSLPAPGPRRVTRCVSFRITSEASPAVPGDPSSPEHRRLRWSICSQLRAIFREAFPSFKSVRVQVLRLPLLRTPGAVQASLEFGGSVPSPSARDVLWTLYRNVKASGQTLAALRVEESSLTCDQSNLSDLAPETVSISAIATSPFPPQLLLPASAPLFLLGEQILREVTPLVSGFYKARPQDDPLLIFRDTAQGLVVHIEYKFQQALPAQLRGLATHLARNIVASILQKSSIVANGEKAELVRYEVWLRIQGPPATQATEDKTSSESRELQARLTRWLTAVLRPLQNLDRVVVEELQPDPLTARLGVTFFGEAPAPERVQDLVHQSLPALRATEGLSAETVLPGPGIPGAEAQPGTPVPSYAVALLALSLLLATPTLVLVLKGRVCPGVFGLRDGKCRRGASGTSDRKHLPLSLANHKKAPRTVDQPEAAHRSAPPPATRPTARRAPLKPAPRALRGGSAPAPAPAPAPGLLQATPERPDVNLEPGRVWHQPEAATQHGAASRLDSGTGTAPAGSRALGTD